MLTETRIISLDLLDCAQRSSEHRNSPYVDQRSVERYEKFLMLCKKYPDKHLVPTHDIDFMWHLHMLNPRNYWSDCMGYFGDILDHNAGFGTQEIEKEEHLNQFNETARLWKLEFSQPYINDDAKSCRSGCKA